MEKRYNIREDGIVLYLNEENLNFFSTEELIDKDLSGFVAILLTSWYFNHDVKPDFKESIKVFNLIVKQANVLDIYK